MIHKIKKYIKIKAQNHFQEQINSKIPCLFYLVEIMMQ